MAKGNLTLLAVAAMALVVVAAPAAGTGSFEDDDGNIHEAAIETIAAAGVTKGCNPPNNDMFCPDRGVTRGEMASFLVRAFDLPGGSSGFTDTSTSVHSTAIDALAASGITRGCNPPANTLYCPDQEVTRAQMATFIVRALNLADDGGGDLFEDDDASVHEQDIDRLAAAGITKGCNPPDNTRYCPAEPVSRAEMATFLMRAMGLQSVTPAAGECLGEPDHTLVACFSVLRFEQDRTIDRWVRNMGYWPRSFKKGLDVNGVPGTEGWQVDRVNDPERYAGWDALSPANSWGFNDYGPNDRWMNFTLNRPSRVAVVWRDPAPIPSWLQSGWVKGGTVQIDDQYAPVYERDFPAGPVELGTVEADGSGRTMYLILLAEADGDQTPPPSTPGGREVPTPGEPCPAWVHGTHRTTGPDGKSYATWHPQWDPVYWCSFGHEHGSNPALIPGSPMVPYGYVAERLGQDEPNMGFKEFIFKDLSDQHWIRFVVHAGTASERRVCARFHTLYVQVYDDSGTELMNVGFKADYGTAVAVREGGKLTTDCANPDLGPERVRRINVSGIDHDYERWDSMLDTTATRNLGFGSFKHAFDIRNPMTECVDMDCNEVQRIVRHNDPSIDNSTIRTISMSGWKSPFVFSVAQSLATGEFYTDPYGTKLVGAGASDSVRQYLDPAAQSVDFLIDPGVNRIMCTTDDPWTMRYGCIEMTDSTPFPHADDMNIQFAIKTN